MTFSLHQGGVVMSSQIMHTQLFNIYPLAHILGTSALISVVSPFPQFTPTASGNGIPPSAGDKPLERERVVRKNTETNQTETLLAIQYSSNLSTCPNHLNTL